MNDISDLLLKTDDYQWISPKDTESNNSKPTLNDLDRWKPLDRFVEEHDQFRLSQLRWLLRDRKGNGLDRAVRKIGKRIYIHDELFAEWMLESD
jgi:hypothetical protein